MRKCVGGYDSILARKSSDFYKPVATTRRELSLFFFFFFIVENRKMDNI